MTTYDYVRMIIALISVLAVFIVFLNKIIFKKNKITTRFLTRTAIFSALAIVLYVVPIFRFNVPFFPSFLDIRFDEVPAIIASFAYGPLSGSFVIIIKTLAKLPLTSTLGVGELCDLLYGLCLVIPAGMIYKKHRSLKGAAIGLLSSSLLQIVISMFFTTFAILPFYMFVMGYPESAILAMCKAANPGVTTLTWPFMFMIALPFNLFRDILLVIITFVLYKRLHRFIDKISQ